MKKYISVFLLVLFGLISIMAGVGESNKKVVNITSGNVQWKDLSSGDYVEGNFTHVIGPVTQKVKGTEVEEETYLLLDYQNERITCLGVAVTPGEGRKLKEFAANYVDNVMSGTTYYLKGSISKMDSNRSDLFTQALAEYSIITGIPTSDLVLKPYVIEPTDKAKTGSLLITVGIILFIIAIISFFRKLKKASVPQQAVATADSSSSAQESDLLMPSINSDSKSDNIEKDKT